MSDFYPSTQVEDDNSILALIRGSRLEEEEDERGAERGTPKAETTTADNSSIVAVQTTGQDFGSLNNVVASLTSQANKVSMSTKLPLPSYSDIQKMTEQEYEDFQNKLQAISYFQSTNNERKRKQMQEKQIAENIEA